MVAAKLLSWLHIKISFFNNCQTLAFVLGFFDPTEEQRLEMLQQYIIINDNGFESCKICGMVYATEKHNRRLNLENHIESQHLKIPAYPCTFCPKIFNSKHRRSCHTTTMHKVEAKAQREFERQQYLQEKYNYTG